MSRRPVVQGPSRPPPSLLPDCTAGGPEDKEQGPKQDGLKRDRIDASNSEPTSQQAGNLREDWMVLTPNSLPSGIKPDPLKSRRFASGRRGHSQLSALDPSSRDLANTGDQPSTDKLQEEESTRSYIDSFNEQFRGESLVQTFKKMKQQKASVANKPVSGPCPYQRHPSISQVNEHEPHQAPNPTSSSPATSSTINWNRDIRHGGLRPSREYTNSLMDKGGPLNTRFGSSSGKRFL